MPLCTIANVKSYLGISQTDSNEDDLITLLIGSTQALIETYCHRHFDVASYVSEQHNINHKIFPRESPIISVENIMRLSDDCIDYRIYNSYIDLLDYKFMTMGNRLKYCNNEESYVEISYTAGYKTMPTDLSLAAIKLVALEYKDSTEDRIGLISRSEGAESESYVAKGIDSEMPLSISAVLDRYKRVSI